MKLDQRHWLTYDRKNFVRINEAALHVLPIAKRAENPVLIPDRPWEEDVHLYGSVHRIHGVYHMWYYARTQAYSVRSVCYAQSDDGIHWIKPELDVTTYDGMPSNIVFGTPVMGDGFIENDTVLYTPWDQGSEYKMLYVARYQRDTEAIHQARLPYYRRLSQAYRDQGNWQMAEKCMQRVNREQNSAIPPSVYIATSSDGIHWREAAAPAVPYVDDISHMMYDPYEMVYRLYGRGFAYDAGRCAADRDKGLFDGYLGRSVFMAKSKDALVWEKEKLVMTADVFDRPGDEIYSLSVFPWEGKYLGLVQMYHGAPQDMTLDIHLALSDDGEHFERVGDRSPIIPLGEIGQWDRFNTCVADCPLTEGETVRIYFNGAVFRHLQISGSSLYSGADTWDRIVRIGAGEVIRDRFACAQASFSGGTLQTVPLTMIGQQLHLNCDSAWGELSVLVRANNRQETFTIAQNGTDISVPLPEWAIGCETTLEFTLKNARLYSFWAE